mgnify:CR=1 FL=1
MYISGLQNLFIDCICTRPNVWQTMQHCFVYWTNTWYIYILVLWLNDLLYILDLFGTSRTVY